MKCLFFSILLVCFHFVDNMDKLEIFYSLANARGIKVMVSPLNVDVASPNPTLISATETSTYASEVD